MNTNRDEIGNRVFSILDTIERCEEHIRMSRHIESQYSANLLMASLLELVKNQQSRIDDCVKSLEGIVASIAIKTDGMELGNDDKRLP